MTGFLNIYKREGISSAYCVNRAKRLTKCPCGHLGTLDPLAEGVLPVGVGNAARLFDYFLGKEKTYLARFRFGWTTETLDRESEPTFAGMVPSKSAVEEILPQFTGEIFQRPPRFSAISVDGKRSYELARKGKQIELPARKVKIFSLTLSEQTAEDEFEFEIVCGSGTYIRSLARDMGETLGTGAYMTKLIRTASGIFTKETAVPLDDFTAENIGEYLIPTESVLPFECMEVGDERFFHGVHVPVDCADGVYKLYHGGQFYGTGIVEEGLLRPDKKLC